MKYAKLFFSAAVVFTTINASADITYKWVDISARQMKEVEANCTKRASERSGALSTSASLGGITAGVGMLGISNAPNVTPAVTSVVAGAGFAALMINLAVHVEPVEALAIIQEQQRHAPGLMTAKLINAAAENDVDANEIVASLNMAAVADELCRNQDDDTLQKILERQVAKESVAHKTAEDLANKERKEKILQQVQK